MFAWLLEQLVFWFLGAIYSLLVYIVIFIVGDIGLAKGHQSLSEFFNVFFGGPNAASNLSTWFKAMYIFAGIVIIVNLIIGIYRIMLENDSNTPQPFKLAYNSCKSMILAMCSVPLMNFILDALGALYKAIIGNNLATAIRTVVTQSLTNTTSTYSGAVASDFGTIGRMFGDVASGNYNAVGGAALDIFNGAFNLVSNLVQGIIMFVVLFMLIGQVIKLVINLCMRYTTLGVMYMFGPLLLSFGGNPTTEGIQKTFLRSFILECIMVTVSQLFLVFIMQGIFNAITVQSTTTGTNILSRALMVVAFMNLTQNLDALVGKLGFHTMSSVSNLGDTMASGVGAPALAMGIGGTAGMMQLARGYSAARDVQKERGDGSDKGFKAKAAAFHAGLASSKNTGLAGTAARLTNKHGKGAKLSNLTAATTARINRDYPAERNAINAVKKTSAQRIADNKEAQKDMKSDEQKAQWEESRTPEERLSDNFAEGINNGDYEILEAYSQNDGSTVMKVRDSKSGEISTVTQAPDGTLRTGEIKSSPQFYNKSLMSTATAQQALSSPNSNAAAGTSYVTRGVSAPDENGNTHAINQIVTKNADGSVSTSGPVNVNWSQGMQAAVVTSEDGNFTYGSMAMDTDTHQMKFEASGSAPTIVNENTGTLNTSGAAPEMKNLTFTPTNSAMDTAGVKTYKGSDENVYAFGQLDEAGYNSLSPDMQKRYKKLGTMNDTETQMYAVNITGMKNDGSKESRQQFATLASGLNVQGVSQATRNKMNSKTDSTTFYRGV